MDVYGSRAWDDEALARFHAPCGLDIGGVSPEEAAISMAAELIRTHSGRSGRPLRSTGGAIHRAQAVMGEDDLAAVPVAQAPPES